jgi:predicted GH43/DUF377 family glycosyl hydrolase
LNLAFSRDLNQWRSNHRPIFESRGREIDGGRLQIANVYNVPKGILVLYFLAKPAGAGVAHSLRAAFFDHHNPRLELADHHQVVWQQAGHDREKLTPVGAARIANRLVSYWQDHSGKLLVFHHPGLEYLWQPVKPKSFHPILSRAHKNPLLRPIVNHYWESQAVFNAAAVYDQGKVHLVYRAVGDDSVSVMGYASSKDGINLDTRLKKPIYVPTQPFETSQPGSPKPSPAYVSGPGCGGCEDPRMTKIDGRFYVTYNAWNGYEPPKVALTSISEDDFSKQRWNWRQPVLISSPNLGDVKNPDRINKNWVIFPEKINGRYAILHSLSPIQVDYFDTLEFDGQTYIDSYREWRPRDYRWDVFIRGVGPPPLKTKDGWLLFYHAASRDCGYNLGAMLLDSQDPTKVLFRANTPVLAPSYWYETTGLKPNIVYSTGAAVIEDQLTVYYGGADTVVCAAQAGLNDFIGKLKDTGNPRLQPVASQFKVINN